MIPAATALAARDQRLSDRSTQKKKGSDRTPAQIDRDRILYSTAFRRLAEITQVVQAAEGHHFHNRLTHVLKVAQIGRRTAERLLNRPDGKAHADALGGLNPDVVEAAGLAHDLGHPPFGHIAEEELSHQAKEQAKIGQGFEGNAQSFRIVTRLAIRKKQRPLLEEVESEDLELSGDEGLDLTRATLNAILKYPWSKQASGDGQKKWGVYQEDVKVFTWAREAALYKNSKTLEAEIMDWSDDIAYAIYDLDDFYRAGLLPLDRLIAPGSRELERFFQSVEDRWQQQDRSMTTFEAHKKQFSVLLSLIARRRALQEPFAGDRSQRAELRDVTSFLVGRYIRAIRMVDPKVLDAPKQAAIKAKGAIKPLEQGPALVEINESMKMEVSFLKQLAWTYVIENPSLVAQQAGQKKIIAGLFEDFFAAANGKTWNIFPVGLRSDLFNVNARFKDDPAIRARAVIDFIGTMTEAQAMHMYSRLNGYSSRSVMDRIIA